MTIDTKNLRVLAEDCMNREIDFDDVSPNQGSTSCDKLTRAYFRDANPAAILALLDALERKDNLLREQLTICKYLSRSICMTDETGADTNPDNIVDSSIEAITKEIVA